MQGSLEHVRILDDFVLSHMATADIDYFEGYPGTDWEIFGWVLDKRKIIT